jgi:hypothetical protein
VASITQVRQALADAVSKIPGLQGMTYPPGTVEPPVAIVLPASGDVIDYTIAMPPDDDAADLHLRIVLLAGSQVDQAATERIDGYLNPSGPLSVRAAVEADPTLGGMADWAVCTGAGRAQLIQWADLEYYSAEVYVDVGGAVS